MGQGSAGHHGYQVGGATASHPLGPWKKLPENPLLGPGALDAWDGGEVASSNIVKMGEGNWTMWYEATPGPHYKGVETASEWSVGIAHATTSAPRPPPPFRRLPSSHLTRWLLSQPAWPLDEVSA